MEFVVTFVVAFVVVTIASQGLMLMIEQRRDNRLVEIEKRMSYSDDDRRFVTNRGQSTLHSRSA